MNSDISTREYIKNMFLLARGIEIKDEDLFIFETMDILFFERLINVIILPYGSILASSIKEAANGFFIKNLILQDSGISSLNFIDERFSIFTDFWLNLNPKVRDLKPLLKVGDKKGLINVTGCKYIKKRQLEVLKNKLPNYEIIHNTTVLV